MMELRSKELLEILVKLDKDKASRKNNVGFNRFDSPIGHYLYRKEEWNLKDLEKAKKLLLKYRRQLMEFGGIEIEDIEKAYLIDKEIIEQVLSQKQTNKSNTEKLKFDFDFEIETINGQKGIFLPKKIAIEIYSELKKYYYKSFFRLIKNQIGNAIFKGDKTFFPIWLIPSLKNVLNKYYIEKFFDIYSEVYFNILENNAKNNKNNEIIEQLNLSKNLFDYQKEGILKGIEQIENKGFTFIADDMGLGKTIQAIGIAKYILKKILEKENKESKIIIFAPKSVVYNWKYEILENFKDFGIKENDVVVLEGTKKRYDKLGVDIAKLIDNAKIIITHYKTAINFEQELLKHNYLIGIFDEVHNVKNPKAKITKLVGKLINKIQYKILLSGTPFTNRLVELINILKIFHLTDNETIKLFYDAIEYNIIRTRKGEIYIPTNTIKKEYQDIIHSYIIFNLMIRREKDDVLDLPPKIREVIYVELINGNKEKYEKLEEEFLAKIEKYREEFKMWKIENDEHNTTFLEWLIDYKKDPIFLKMFNNLYHNISKLKIDTTIDFVQNLLLENMDNKKVVIFAYTKEAQKKLFEKLTALGYKVGKITAEMDMEERQESIEKFQNTNDIEVLIIGLKVGSEGITLTASNTVVFHDLWFQPQLLRQAEDRIYRIGQNKTAYIYYLITKGTIEERIWDEIIKPKLDSFDGIFKLRKEKETV